MPNTQQIPLKLRHPVSYDLSDFIVSASNSNAFQFLNVFAEGKSHFGTIIGPVGSGKTHLLQGWGKAIGAQNINPGDNVSDLQSGKIYIIDDINQLNSDSELSYPDAYLFHLYNWTKEINAKLIATADDAPSRWGRNLPDLVSRLGTAQVVSIEEPDDELLLVVLLKLFSDRQLQVDINVLNYTIKLMERSFSAAQRLVELVDNTALAEKRKITKTLVRSCLEAL